MVWGRAVDDCNLQKNITEVRLQHHLVVDEDFFGVGGEGRRVGDGDDAKRLQNAKKYYGGSTSTTQSC